jgi:hypothetical protein
MIMKKLYMAAMALAVSSLAAAQDTYESGRLLGSDLNGTARYVGMGGAMDALGADLSTISSNPAGIGLFRHSTASVSVGLVSMQDVQKFDGLSKTKLSFDQIGFVYSARVSRKSFVNFAFNYHKSRNFNQILSAAAGLSQSSSNDLSYHKAERQSENNGGWYWDNTLAEPTIGYVDQKSDLRALTYSQADWLNANVLMKEQRGEKDWPLYSNYADAYAFDRAHRGWINDFDFNISGNSNDRFYWGVTIGIHDVNYRGNSTYAESLIDSQGDAGTVTYNDERKITGTGFDIKAGVIIRPVEASPFRFGLTIATPTWYNLKSQNNTTMYNDSYYGAYNDGNVHETYDFKYYTPWKFGVSLGHTVGRMVALGLGYEYSDYGAAQNRVNNGTDYYGNTASTTDQPMKRNTENALKGVHTVKAGVELKPDPALAVRFGYNFVSAAYDKNGMRDMTIPSYGVMYASTNDYTNWKATHRLTCGIGYKFSNISLDAAYQYSATKGDFHPFQPYANDMGAVEVANKRHQVLLTLGYTF